MKEGIEYKLLVQILDVSDKRRPWAFKKSNAIMISDEATEKEIKDIFYKTYMDFVNGWIDGPDGPKPKHK